MTERLDALSTFLWCSSFAAAAATFQVLLDAFSERNDGKKWTRREFARAGLHVSSIGFWGGLAGWTVEHILPGASGEMLGIVAAVLGSGGHSAMKVFMTSVLERTLGVKIVEVKA